MSDVNRQNEKFYSERDVIRQGQVYVNHVFHMTSEGLHSKSDIAAELAHRDLKIIELEQRIKELEQDARRYRFLRDTYEPGPREPRVHIIDQDLDTPSCRFCHGDELDAAIDAAINGENDATK